MALGKLWSHDKGIYDPLKVYWLTLVSALYDIRYRVPAVACATFASLLFAPIDFLVAAWHVGCATAKRFSQGAGVAGGVFSIQSVWKRPLPSELSRPREHRAPPVLLRLSMGEVGCEAAAAVLVAAIWLLFDPLLSHHVEQLMRALGQSSSHVDALRLRVQYGGWRVAGGVVALRCAADRLAELCGQKPSPLFRRSASQHDLFPFVGQYLVIVVFAFALDISRAVVLRPSDTSLLYRYEAARSSFEHMLGDTVTVTLVETLAHYVFCVVCGAQMAVGIVSWQAGRACDAAVSGPAALDACGDKERAAAAAQAAYVVRHGMSMVRAMSAVVLPCAQSIPYFLFFQAMSLGNMGDYVVMAGLGISWVLPLVFSLVVDTAGDGSRARAVAPARVFAAFSALWIAVQLGYLSFFVWRFHVSFNETMEMTLAVGAFSFATVAFSAATGVRALKAVFLVRLCAQCGVGAAPTGRRASSEALAHVGTYAGMRGMPRIHVPLRTASLVAGALLFAIGLLAFDRDEATETPASVAEDLVSAAGWQMYWHTDGNDALTQIVRAYVKVAHVSFALLFLFMLAVLRQAARSLASPGRWPRTSPWLYGALLAGGVAVILPVAPDYLGALDLNALCRHCAPGYDRMVRTFVKSIVGVAVALFLMGSLTFSMLLAVTGLFRGYRLALEDIEKRFGRRTSYVQGERLVRFLFRLTPVVGWFISAPALMILAQFAHDSGVRALVLVYLFAPVYAASLPDDHIVLHLGLSERHGLYSERRGYLLFPQRVGAANNRWRAWWLFYFGTLILIAVYLSTLRNWWTLLRRHVLSAEFLIDLAAEICLGIVVGSDFIVALLRAAPRRWSGP